MTPKTWAAAGAAALLVVGGAAAGIGLTSGGHADPAVGQQAVANTAKVEQGKLAAMVTVNGTLTYQAGSDGSPYKVINRAAGTYTDLPDPGGEINCGHVLYRVDQRPVLLLCGAVPIFRTLTSGEEGKDVARLNRNLHTLGYDHTAGVAINPDDEHFTSDTRLALEKLQHDRNVAATGHLDTGDAVFLPTSVRIAHVDVTLGGPARPDAAVLQATSDTLQVQVELDSSQQGQVKTGQHAQITLPGNRSANAAVDRLGTVAQTTGNGQDPGAATTRAYLRLDDPAQARGLDQAPVQVAITTQGVENALSVPVTAILAKSGGGYAVEAVGPDKRRTLVPVKLGLFDAAGGRVQVEGNLHAGDDVVVPSL